jgi:hypothetical protein
MLVRGSSMRSSGETERLLFDFLLTFPSLL